MGRINNSISCCTFLSGVIAAGGHFDIAAFHNYSGTVVSEANSYRSVLAAHGMGNTPIWVGEYGEQSAGCGGDCQSPLITQVLTSGAPIAMAQWYNLRDTNSYTCCPPNLVAPGSWGVLNANYTPKASFSTMQHLLGGSGVVTSPRPSAAPTPRPTAAPTVKPTAATTGGSPSGGQSAGSNGTSPAAGGRSSPNPGLSDGVGAATPGIGGAQPSAGTSKVIAAGGANGFLPIGIAAFVIVVILASGAELVRRRRRRESVPLAGLEILHEPTLVKDAGVSSGGSGRDVDQPSARAAPGQPGAHPVQFATPIPDGAAERPQAGVEGSDQPAGLAPGEQPPLGPDEVG